MAYPNGRKILEHSMPPRRFTLTLPEFSCSKISVDDDSDVLSNAKPRTLAIAAIVGYQPSVEDETPWKDS